MFFFCDLKFCSKAAIKSEDRVMQKISEAVFLKYVICLVDLSTWQRISRQGHWAAAEIEARLRMKDLMEKEASNATQDAGEWEWESVGICSCNARNMRTNWFCCKHLQANLCQCHRPIRIR